MIEVGLAKVPSILEPGKSDQVHMYLFQRLEASRAALKARRGQFSVLCVVCTAALLLSSFLNQDRSTYNGRSLQSWIGDLYPITSRYSKAYQAVQKSGTNAIPTVMRLLKSRDSIVTRKLIQFNNAFPSLSFPITPAAKLHEQAVTALFVLGPVAKPALPGMLELLERDDTAEQIGRVLRYVDSNPEIKLVRMLTNHSAVVRSAGARVLREAEYKPSIVVPALVKCLGDKDDEVRFQADVSLLRMDKEVVITTLISNLEVDDLEVRRGAIRKLGQFGKDARRAVLPLIRLTGHSDPETRESAMTTLTNIAPEAQ